MLLLAGLGAAAAAHADLYRWVDPQTGSVKLSSVPPPWQGERGAPAVEVLPPRAAPARLPERKAPGKPAEARWRTALESLARLVAAGDAESIRAARPQLEAFQALSAELDRADPGGTKRRRAEAEAILKGAAR